MDAGLILWIYVDNRSPKKIRCECVGKHYIMGLVGYFQAEHITPVISIHSFYIMKSILLVYCENYWIMVFLSKIFLWEDGNREKEHKTGDCGLCYR